MHPAVSVPQSKAMPQDLGRTLIIVITYVALIAVSVHFFSTAWFGYSRHVEALAAAQATALASSPTPSLSTPTLAAIGAGETDPNFENGSPNPANGLPAVFQMISNLSASPTPASTPTPLFTPTPTATPDPGTRRVSSVDGMVNVYIPSGNFLMGMDTHDGRVERADQPRHTVYLDDFWIDLTQVTNAMYALCVEAGACSLPIRQEINPHYYDPAYRNHPAVYIIWNYARDYCAWVGGRLPTEAEWERAASGDGNRFYPWGSERPKSDQANVDNHHSGTVEVGSYPAGASPFGVLDMGSNVREWTADWFSAGYYSNSPFSNPSGPDSAEKKALRGASWHDPAEFAKVTNRLAHVPDSAGDNRGFRCVFDH